MGGFYEDDNDIVALKLSHKQRHPDMLVQMDSKQALRIGSAREGESLFTVNTTRKKQCNN